MFLVCFISFLQYPVFNEQNTIKFKLRVDLSKLNKEQTMCSFRDV